MQPLAVTRQPISQEKVSVAIGILTAAIAAAGEIVAIYLFGSAAAGKMTDQSDIDLLVVTSDVAAIKPAQKNLRNVQRLTDFIVDLVWVDEAQFERKKSLGGVCMVAAEDGRCLYQKNKE